MPLLNLKDKRIVQIACGESHSLALTDKGYLYSWGRGFEGQLGLSEVIEIASVPSFVKYFHGTQVKHIAAGSFHSLAITENGSMYSWGEARMGALGTGKHRDVRIPNQITFPDAGVKMAQCSAGYGHSASISSEGQLYSWGFNVYGQACGEAGNLKTQWTP